MSKSKGNVVNPFQPSKYRADVVRWYMIENAPPWDNLKFDFDGIVETAEVLPNAHQHVFFLRAVCKHRWLRKDEMNNVLCGTSWLRSISGLSQRTIALIEEVTAAYNDYEPTKAARAIQEFVNDHLSNWYVRLNRKRFWR